MLQQAAFITTSVREGGVHPTLIASWLATQYDEA